MWVSGIGKGLEAQASYKSGHRARRTEPSRIESRKAMFVVDIDSTNSRMRSDAQEEKRCKTAGGLLEKPLLPYQQTYIPMTSGETVGDSSLDVTVVNNMDEQWCREVTVETTRDENIISTHLKNSSCSETLKRCLNASCQGRQAVSDQAA